MREFKTQKEMAKHIAANGCDGIDCAVCQFDSSSDYYCGHYPSESEAARAYLSSLEAKEAKAGNNVSLTFDASLITSLTINGVVYVFDEETQELVVKK